jgi:beta-1,4-mannooligosaccharide/beta-1,4-mannosyl-N-acetylglucosamine phosphorylase
MLLRVQTRGRRTVLMRADSLDGERFTVRRGLVDVRGLERIGRRVHHVYDPRITRLEGRWYVTCALDLDDGCRVGLFTTDDFAALDFLALTGDRDVRNAVLFPEPIGGWYLLLERPNAVAAAGGVASGDVVELRASTDLLEWQTLSAVMQGRWHYWDELIGPGPPPIKTPAGWLLIYHGVATHLGGGIYQAGAVLLDLADPAKVLGRTRDNILEPREMYEMVGQVPNVVFPTGAATIPPDEDGCVPLDSELSLYYGAADTCVGLATARVGDLVEACANGK